MLTVLGATRLEATVLFGKVSDYTEAEGVGVATIIVTFETPENGDPGRERRETITDARSHYRIDGLPAEVRLDLDCSPRVGYRRPEDLPKSMSLSQGEHEVNITLFPELEKIETRPGSFHSEGVLLSRWLDGLPSDSRQVVENRLRASLGQVSSTIHDEGGQELPGTLVELVSCADQTRLYTTVSGTNGEFLFRSVPKGKYSIHFAQDGFSQTATKLEVRADRTQPIEVTMGLAEVTEEVIVTSESPILDLSILPHELGSTQGSIELLPLARSKENGGSPDSM